MAAKVPEFGLLGAVSITTPPFSDVPQHLTPPLVGKAQDHAIPVAMSNATRPAGTAVCPLLLSPQHSTAPFERSPHVWLWPADTFTKPAVLCVAHSGPTQPGWHVQAAVPLASEQVPWPLHDDGEKVAHVGRHVWLLSLSWKPAAQVWHSVPPKPGSQVQRGVPVESEQVPRKLQLERACGTQVEPHRAEPLLQLQKYSVGLIPDWHVTVLPGSAVHGEQRVPHEFTLLSGKHWFPQRW
ncbi:MAG: hypothetical protein MUC96_21340 [Myxococcaceae bacterium]|jgi:hypothetical protein|nr:hypothetical protein [Myxococcaceae bacterium]